jgi:hypothetical protein
MPEIPKVVALHLFVKAMSNTSVICWEEFVEEPLRKLIVL